MIQYKLYFPKGISTNINTNIIELTTENSIEVSKKQFNKNEYYYKGEKVKLDDIIEGEDK